MNAKTPDTAMASPKPSDDAGEQEDDGRGQPVPAPKAILQDDDPNRLPPPPPPV